MAPMALRPLDVVAVMGRLSIPKDLCDAFYEETELSDALTMKELVEALRKCGVPPAGRMAIKQALEAPAASAADVSTLHGAASEVRLQGGK